MRDNERERLMEKDLGGREVFSGRVFSVEVRDVALSDGERSTREIVRHPGGAAILALTSDLQMPLIWQYRAPYGELIPELPAGKVERGESPLACAQRELLEECGLSSDNWQMFLSFYPSPGYLDESIHVFIARDCQKVQEMMPDPGEFIHCEWISLAEAYQRVLRGEIKDAKTQLALLHHMCLESQEAEVVYGEND